VPRHLHEALIAFYRDDVRRLVEAFPEIDLAWWPSFGAR
jgi:hypothetical protein